MEIMEGIHQVDEVNANVYLVIDGEELTLIDTGMPKSTEKILNYILKIKRQPSNISKIVLTHCHIDHVGSAHELKKLTNAKVAIHQEDAEFLAGKKTLPTPKGIIGITFKVFSPVFKFTPVQPDITLRENDKVGRLIVIHTPGHAPGSIALYDPERKVLFAGDTVRFTEGKINGPPEPLTLDMPKAIQSIEKISKLDFEVMLSGHGEPLKTNASNRVKEFYSTLPI
jgi:glyoxylase-like metal-dependent hydrolase (beta-lactamase superfamily II)